MQLLRTTEIAKVRASLFQINGVKKEPLKLPEPDGTPVTLNEKVYVPVREHPDVSIEYFIFSFNFHQCNFQFDSFHLFHFQFIQLFRLTRKSTCVNCVRVCVWVSAQARQNHLNSIKFIGYTRVRHTQPLHFAHALAADHFLVALSLKCLWIKCKRMLTNVVKCSIATLFMRQVYLDN